MEEVCKSIKIECDVPDFDNTDGYCKYIDFNSFENEEWTDDNQVDYIRTELRKHLGSDIKDIQDVIINGKIIVQFSYKGHWGEVWETCNSNGYHYWVMSI
jgi:hypothetical protein